ncbi:MAG: hypothetical protein WHS87_10505 [Anaerolineales bacterium]
MLGLKKKFDSYAMQPGWTLVKYDQHDLLPTTGPKSLPAKHQRVIWQHFNEERQVFEEIEYAISPEIGTVLLGYFVNGEAVSLWHDGIRQAQQPYTPTYDLYLASSLKGLLDSRASFTLDSRESSLSGKRVKVFELKTKFSDEEKKWIAVKLAGEVWGSQETFYFDAESGMLLRYEHRYLLEDMSSVPVSVTDNFEIVPNATLPEEVIQLLENIKRR